VEKRESMNNQEGTEPRGHGASSVVPFSKRNIKFQGKTSRKNCQKLPGDGVKVSWARSVKKDVVPGGVRKWESENSAHSAEKKELKGLRGERSLAWCIRL